MDTEPKVEASAAAALDAILRDFGPSADRTGMARSGPAHVRVALDPEAFPDAVLAYLLEVVLGLVDLGRHEKLAWEYPFTYRGVTCSVASEKLGLRLRVARGGASPADESLLAEEVVDALVRAMRTVERRVLRPFAEAQMRAGNVTVLNQGRRLRLMFEYFRDAAEAAYKGEGRLPKRTPDGWTRLMPEVTEGFYNAFAMVTAYFSWLEHILVLAHPIVVGTEPSSGVAGFARLGWRRKFKELLSIESNVAASRIYSRLTGVADDFRNPWAHGALDPRHGALAFHLPRFGAVLVGVRPSDFSPTFYPIPFGKRAFDRAISELAAVDEFLHSHPKFGLAMLWVGSGLDVAFDAESRAEYAAAAADGVEAFEEFVERSAYIDDLHTNMDW